jgi:hypothetical protein
VAGASARSGHVEAEAAHLDYPGMCHGRRDRHGRALGAHGEALDDGAGQDALTFAGRVKLMSVSADIIRWIYARYYLVSSQSGAPDRCPLCIRLRTQVGHRAMSEKCQKETHAPQQLAASGAFDSIMKGPCCNSVKVESNQPI